MDFIDKFLTIVMIVVDKVMDIVDAIKKLMSAVKTEESTDAA